MDKVQDLSNHTRWHPPFHFFLAPVMLINLIYSVVRLIQDPGWDRGEYMLLAVALVVLTLLSRGNALRVQDRLIRLEEQIRFSKVLTPELSAKAMNLRASQYIGLRFASDEELPELVQKVVDGEVSDVKDIKTSVKKWRADFFRV